MSHRILMIALAFSACAPSWAGEILDFEACAREAASRNYDVQAAEEAVAKARAEHRAGYAPFLPQLSAVADCSRGMSESETNGSFSRREVANEYTYALNAKQSLFSGFRDKFLLDRLSVALEGAEARLALAKSKLSADLKSSFAQRVFAEEQKRLAREIASRRKGNYDLVELRFESGRENKGSLLRSHAYLKQAEYEVSQADRTLLLSQHDLLRILARSPTSSVEIDTHLPTPKMPDRPSFSDLAESTPQFLIARSDARLAEKSFSAALAGFFPDLSINGSLGRHGSTFPPGGEKWSVGVTLSIPLFPGGKNIADYSAARAEKQRAELTFQSVRDQISLSLQQRFLDLVDAIERAEVQDEFFLAAKMRSEVARTKYTNGLLSFEDWDLIENDLITTQKAQLLSFRDALLAEAAWEQVCGRGVIR